jgi:hypothetical protein
VLLLAVLGCGGDDDGGSDSGSDAAGCATLETAPLGTVPATEWDPGLPPAMDAFESLSGRWTAATDCGLGTIGIKLVGGTRDDLQVVTTPYAPGYDCGCVTDPAFGPDTDYGPIATFTGLSVYLETWDDPGVQGQSVDNGGALYGAGAPFEVRACGRQDIEPYLLSAWDSLTTVVRVTGGTLEGTVRLATDEGETSVCALTDFQFVEGL